MKINNGYEHIPEKKCPYCGEVAKIVDSKVVYRTVSYGLIYLCTCQPSWAYTSVGGNSTLANKQLRELRKKAHKLFDKSWRTRYITRSEAYKFLSIHMSKAGKDCHIAMFNDDECEAVISLTEQPRWWSTLRN